MFERFIEALKAEVDRTTLTEVAFRVGATEGAVRKWLTRESDPKGRAVIKAINAYPAVLASVLPDGITVADFALPSERKERAGCI